MTEQHPRQDLGRHAQDRTVDVDDVLNRVAGLRRRFTELAGHRVDLIAVTKGFGADAIRAAVAAGCDGVGENYAQELLHKVILGDPGIPVHFIGRIQSNKVRSLIGHVDLWQSVDRVSVIDELSRRAATDPPRVLIQVNTTGEPDKGGVDPSGLDDMVSLATARGLVVEGLMTMGPTSGSAEETQRAFRLLRSLVERTGLETCSMGMSDDYEVALECGSTMVRIGSALFGPRPPR